MARSGLRMMPTFPLPSLKFPTPGFPQYVFKAGWSDKAFPCDAALASISLPSSFVLPATLIWSPFCAGGRGALKHLRSNGFCRSTPGALAPIRVLLSRSVHAYREMLMLASQTLRVSFAGPVRESGARDADGHSYHQHARSTPASVGYRAGNGNRIPSQISKPHRNKV